MFVSSTGREANFEGVESASSRRVLGIVLGQSGIAQGTCVLLARSVSYHNVNHALGSGDCDELTLLASESIADPAVPPLRPSFHLQNSCVRQLVVAERVPAIRAIRGA
jgi:hypothetical protein